MKRKTIGSNEHRSGWPSVIKALNKFANNDGILLDDFTDASFTYTPIMYPHWYPWVGIFHHPVTVNSPLKSDMRRTLLSWSENPYWKISCENLKGCITLCEEAAIKLEELKRPILKLWHPSEKDVQLWKKESLEKRNLVQIGSCFRNTQLIYQIKPPNWKRRLLNSLTNWYKNRHKQLDLHPSIDREQVEIIPRVSNDGYDEILANSVIISEYYAIAASNLVVECMVRGTPLICNRLPSLEEYLGKDYPLFWDNKEDINVILSDNKRIIEGSNQILERSAKILTFDEFALTINNWITEKCS